MMANRTVKNVVFTDRDSDVLSFVSDKKFSTYVKGLIREDIKKKESPNVDLSAFMELMKKATSTPTEGTQEIQEVQEYVPEVAVEKKKKFKNLMGDMMK